MSYPLQPWRHTWNKAILQKILESNEHGWNYTNLFCSTLYLTWSVEPKSPSKSDPTPHTDPFRLTLVWYNPKYLLPYKEKDGSVGDCKNSQGNCLVQTCLVHPLANSSPNSHTVYFVGDCKKFPRKLFGTNLSRPSPDSQIKLHFMKWRVYY